MTFEVGSYQFSDHDAQRTWDLTVDEFIPNTGGSQVEHLRSRLTSLTERSELSESTLAELWDGMFATHAALVADDAITKDRGSVVHLARSDGGVPKTSANGVDIDYGGVVGDRQATRLHHGAPFQALCLWSKEVIDDLAAAGHSVSPGAAGENITVSGIDWTAVKVGQRLQIGEAEAQITAAATPCSNLADLFSDRDFRRIDESNGPLSRMYAAVVNPGRVNLSDVVELY